MLGRKKGRPRPSQQQAAPKWVPFLTNCVIVLWWGAIGTYCAFFCYHYITGRSPLSGGGAAHFGDKAPDQYKTERRQEEFLQHQERLKILAEELHDQRLWPGHESTNEKLTGNVLLPLLDVLGGKHEGTADGKGGERSTDGGVGGTTDDAGASEDGAGDGLAAHQRALQGVKFHNSSTDKQLPNIWFVKGFKVGGSTMSGVIRRLNQRNGGPEEEWGHTMRNIHHFGRRLNPNNPRVIGPNWVPGVKAGRADTGKPRKGAGNRGGGDGGGGGGGVRKKQLRPRGRRRLQVRLKENSYATCCNGDAPHFFVQHASYQAIMRTDHGLDPVDPKVLSEAFVLTLIRHPVDRIVSNYYHRYVSRQKMPDTLANQLKFVTAYLREAESTQFDYLRAKDDTAVQQALSHYNLLGTTERFDETIVLMKMLLNLSLADIVYINAKTADGKTYDEHGVLLAAKPASKDIHPDMRRAIMDSGFAIEAVMWKEVNRRMDEMIGGLQPLFDEELETFQAAQRKVQAECTKGVHALKKGDPAIKCIYHDQGCNYPCMEALSEKEGWDEI